MTVETGPFPFRRVGVVGLGLLGGSLARALKRLTPAPYVRALSREAFDLQAARESGVVDHATMDPAGFPEELDLVVYCTPLEATLRLLETHRDWFSSTALVTDVVSLKVPVLEKARALELHPVFVGSHPMAGGEGTGFQASRDGLFAGARVWTVEEGASVRAVEGIQGLWTALGGVVHSIEAREHDRLMAWTSHLPQLTATALASAMDDAGLGWQDLGPGGRDTMRLAGSGPEMWGDLLRYAPPDLLTALQAAEGHLARVRSALQEGKVEEVARLMERTREWKEGNPWT